MNMDEYPLGTVMVHPGGLRWRQAEPGVWEYQATENWCCPKTITTFDVPPLWICTPPPEPDFVKPLTVGELEDWVVFEHDGLLRQAGFDRSDSARWCAPLGAGQDSGCLHLSTIPTKVYGILGRDCEITMIETEGA